MHFIKKRCDKMDIKYTKYPNGYVKVKELIPQTLPRPKHRSRFIYNDGEFLPIITVEAPI